MTPMVIAETGDSWKKFHQGQENYLMWGRPGPPTIPEYTDRLKLAWVYTKEGKHEMVWLHKDDERAYVIGEWYTKPEPLMEVQYEKLDRWCTTFDT